MSDRHPYYVTGSDDSPAGIIFSHSCTAAEQRWNEWLSRSFGFTDQKVKCFPLVREHIAVLPAGAIFYPFDRPGHPSHLRGTRNERLIAELQKLHGPI